MKIAFIGQKGIPTVSGGVEKHVEELAVELARKGHEVTVYSRPSYTDKRVKEYKGVNLISLPSIPTKNLDAITHTFLATVHSLFGRYDVAHFHSIGPSSLAFIPRIFSRKTAVVATFHCQDYLHQKWGLLAKAYLKFGEFMAVKIPHKTIAVSNEIRKYAERKYKRELVVVPNGMRVEATENTNELRKWNVKRGEYFLVVSRLIRHKGIHYLIEAYKELKKEGKHQGKKLMIVGDGFHTDDYVDFLKKNSGKDRDIIFTGNQTGESLRQIFSGAYLFIQPSESEGLSIALLEALGYGLATLVSNIPENFEAIGGAGFSFENKNVKDLKDKLFEAVENPRIVSEMGIQAKIFANKKYNWKNLASEVEDVYSEAISSKNKKKGERICHLMKFKYCSR